MFNSAFEIIGEIEAAGGEAYIVGGAVRDALIGRPIGDVDIATSLRPEEIQNIFEKVIPIGIEHGTVMVRYHSESYEVTTYRKEEGYEDFRHPDEVTFVGDIREDLARRDFTMNAMAMGKDQTIVDPFGGQQAIKDKVIQAVGHPKERFFEDPLRMIRAVRFASQLGFTVESKTEEAINEQAPLLKHIAIERIANEMIKLLAGQHFSQGFHVLCTTGMMEEFPLFQSQFDVKSHVPYVSLNSWPEAISYFVEKGIGENVKDWVKEWKLSNQIRHSAESIRMAYKEFQLTSSITPWLVYRLPRSLDQSFVRLIQAIHGEDHRWQVQLSEQANELAIENRKDLAFQAADLIQLFHDEKKGSWIEEYMTRIERTVVEGNIKNDYETIKEWVQQWNRPVNN
ncbi:CCA tRNA nucleotidyltransferase [Halobacillus locisalis]|nr:CCA tRNA nucleotidyltransferase [Halobacillus locisalis]